MGLKPGYKQTEVGVVPEEWVVRRLGDIAHVKTGSRNNQDKIEDGRYPFFVRSETVERINSFSYDCEAILVPGEGRIGNIFHYINGRFDVHQRVYAITEFSPSTCARFVHFYMLMNFGAHAMQNTVKATVDSLRLPTFLNFELLMPPSLEEQTAIAGALSDVDALIDVLGQLIAKKRDLKQAAMQQLLTGRTRLPTFRGGWEVRKLGSVLRYEQPTDYLVGSSDYDDNYDVAVLTANKSFVLGYTDEHYGVCETLPVVIFDDFTTATKYVDFPFKVKSSALKILRLRDGRDDLRYLFWRMQLIRFPLGDHKRYWISEYQNIEIPVPSPAEQSAITAVLVDMDAEIAALEACRDKTRALKQGMMQELLTGRTRLV